MKENVFIAWGGNQPLAIAVSEKLEKGGFNGIVGGSSPTDMFIGTQVFGQIRKCTQAIILVQSKSKTESVFSRNLMFEWGYLTAKMEPHKIHVFLIGESVKNLPRDLSDVWATEVELGDRDAADIAAEISKVFKKAATRSKEVNKMEVFYKWSETKKMLCNYKSAPMCSERELAHIILHSMEVSHYYMENKAFCELVNTIVPTSPILEFTIKLIKANIRLFEESAGFAKPLSFDTFAELRDIFETQFDFSSQDDNLNLWLNVFCASRLGLIYRLVAENPDSPKEQKEEYLQMAIDMSLVSFNVLTDIAIKFPKEAQYTRLYEGYRYRNLFKCYVLINDTESAQNAIALAIKARESFYLHYKQKHPSDMLLIRRLGEEYYLSCAESLPFITDPIDKKIMENNIRSFLEKLEGESERQHVVLQQLYGVLGIKKD